MASTLTPTPLTTPPYHEKRDGGGTRTRTGDDGFAIRCLSHLAMPPWGSLGFTTLGAPARSLADPGDEKDSGVEALVKWGSQTIDQFLG